MTAGETPAAAHFTDNGDVTGGGDGGGGDRGDASGDREALLVLRWLANGLLQVPDDQDHEEQDGELLLEILGAHLGRRRDSLVIVAEEVPEHRLVDADIALAEIAGRDPPPGRPRRRRPAPLHVAG